MSPRLVNVCPATTSLNAPGPTCFAVKTPGPAGGTISLVSAAAREKQTAMPRAMPSFMSLPSLLRQQFRIWRPDLQRIRAPTVHRHAQRLLQRQADTRHWAVVAGDVITGLDAAAGAAGNQDRQTVYGMDPGVGLVGERHNCTVVQQG